MTYFLTAVTMPDEKQLKEERVHLGYSVRGHIASWGGRCSGSGEAAGHTAPRARQQRDRLL